MKKRDERYQRDIQPRSLVEALERKKLKPIRKPMTVLSIQNTSQKTTDSATPKTNRVGRESRYCSKSDT